MKWFYFLLIISIFIGSIAIAGEKEELQWKLRALSDESQIIQVQKERNDREIQDFLKDLDAKGYMIGQGGVIIEKPKKPDK
jgi:hypothetical protein